MERTLELKVVTVTFMFSLQTQGRRNFTSHRVVSEKKIVKENIIEKAVFFWMRFYNHINVSCFIPFLMFFKR